MALQSYLLWKDLDEIFPLNASFEGLESLLQHDCSRIRWNYKRNYTELESLLSAAQISLIGVELSLKWKFANLNFSFVTLTAIWDEFNCKNIMQSDENSWMQAKPIQLG